MPTSYLVSQALLNHSGLLPLTGKWTGFSTKISGPEFRNDWAVSKTLLTFLLTLKSLLFRGYFRDPFAACVLTFAKEAELPIFINPFPEVFEAAQLTITQGI